MNKNRKIICTRCGESCEVDGEYPEFICWCEICNDIPGSWNADDFSADYVAAVMDWGREIRKYG